jgi:hypothetical protein
MNDKTHGERLAVTETQIKGMSEDITAIKIAMQSLIIHVAKSKGAIILASILMPCVGAIASVTLAHFWK